MGTRVKVLNELGLAAHVCNAATLRAETGGSQVLTGQPGLQTKTLV